MNKVVFNLTKGGSIVETCAECQHSTV